MQRLGEEFNLSETAWFSGSRRNRGNLRGRLRLFTATAEVPLPGHPLLGAAALLAQRHGRVREVRLPIPENRPLTPPAGH